MDFEATNGHLLRDKMFNGRDSRRVIERRRVVILPKQEKRLKMKGNNYREPEGNIRYPLFNEKKIFGMKPKTLGVALGIIVISIWVLSRTGDSSGNMVNNGGTI